MRTIFKAISPVLLATLLVGCHTPTTMTPREAFFQKHPDLRTRYDEFYETSPEAIADANDEKLTFGIIQIHVIQKAYAKYPDLVQQLSTQEKRLETFRDEGLPIVSEIKKVFDPKTDALFWYNGNGQGYVIVRNGDFYRTFWAVGPAKRPDEIP